MCLGRGGDFAHLGDAAAADDVGHVVVGELAVEEVSKVPVGDEPLADADDGHGDLVLMRVRASWFSRGTGQFRRFFV